MTIDSIVDFRDKQVFQGASTYTAIHVIDKVHEGRPLDYAGVVKLEDGEALCRDLDMNIRTDDAQRFAARQPRAGQMWFFDTAESEAYLSALEAKGRPLFPDIASAVFQGVISGADGVFLAEEWSAGRARGTIKFRSAELGEDVEIEESVTVPVVRRSEWAAFGVVGTARLILPYDRDSEALLPSDELEARFPRTWRYLLRSKDALASREKGRFADRWWGLSRAQNLRRWCGAKVLLPYMVDHLSAAWDEAGQWFVNVTTGGYGLELTEGPVEEWPYYVVGLLNSRPLDYWLRHRSNHFQGGYFPANKQFVEKLPIVVPRSREERDTAKRIIEAAKWLGNASRREHAETLGDRERDALRRGIATKRKAIEAAVGELYGVEPPPVED